MVFHESIDLEWHGFSARQTVYCVNNFGRNVLRRMVIGVILAGRDVLRRIVIGVISRGVTCSDGLLSA